MKPCQELSLTSPISDERRIKYCQFLPSMQSMLVLRACQQHFVPRKHLVEKILAYNVVMLHSDQEPMLVQLLKAVQSRRVKRTLVRHGPRASHQSQGKIENANRVINGVCRAMRQHLDSVVDSTRSMVPDEISSEKRRKNFVCACFWESVHEPSVAIRKKSDVQVHIRANWQSGSEMVPRNLGWQGANDRRTHHGSRKRDRCTACHLKKDSSSVSQKKVRGLFLEWQGGKLESDDCDATGPRPIWTSTCVPDD